MVHDFLSTTLLPAKHAFCNFKAAFAISSQHNDVFASRSYPCKMKECCAKSSLSSNTSFQNSSGEDQNQSIGSGTASDPSHLFELLSPIESVQPDQMSASMLAYLGDVVFELFIRSRYVWPERRMSDLQNKVVSIVRADAQAILLARFLENFPITSAEKTVLSRGRNANLSARKKMKGTQSTSSGASNFQDSTAFEALLGYTYISDKARFMEMINAIKLLLDEMDNS